MGFSSKRGRPKLQTLNVKEKRDLGTAELQRKRSLGLTKEPIDIVREKELIDENEYWAALHFRWLYTLRFGAPNISALGYESFSNRGLYTYDEAWHVEKEKESSMAVAKLRAAGALKIVMNTVLFNYSAKFLMRGDYDKAQLLQNALELEKFREGLKILAELWGRN